MSVGIIIFERSVSHVLMAEYATEESINMAVSASTKCVLGRQEERTVADRLSIMISESMSTVHMVASTSINILRIPSCLRIWDPLPSRLFTSSTCFTILLASRLMHY
jgi:hypothetical protein